MIGNNDPLRISQTALNRAGQLGLHRAVNKAEGETLSGVLKYMVENSAIATGRRKNQNRARANRRRYGSFILVLMGHVLVGVYCNDPKWCPKCLGLRTGCGICN